MIMNEYTIYFCVLLTSLLFQIFWSWCNSKQPATPTTKEGRDELIELYIKEALAEAENAHKEETNKLSNLHKETLKRKRKQLHESCQRRNATIKELKERNYALQEQIREDKETKNLVVLKVLEALKPLDG